MSTKIALTLAVVLSASLCFGTHPPPPPTIEVGTCLPGYTHFATIQAAVTAAPAGATILVCPGIYPEQVTITKALTVTGVTLPTASGATIVPPVGGMVQNATSLVSGRLYAAQVLIQNTKNVTLTNLTVDGTNDQIPACEPYLVGVLFQNASGALSYMAVVNQILGPGLTGCQGGLAIFVQSDGIGGTSKVDVADSVVQNFAKNGITGTEVGTKLTVECTRVVGIGLTPLPAQNGVEFGFGATGSITDSSVADVAYADPLSYAAVGILLYGSPNVVVKNNVVANTDTGVYTFSAGVDGSASGAIIANNQISATHTWDGIALCSNNNTVTGNTISTSDESGVFVGGFCLEPDSSPSGKYNKIKTNVINRACAGLMFSFGATPATNTVAGNSYFNVDTKVLTADACAATTLTLNALSVGGGGGGSRLQTAPVR